MDKLIFDNKNKLLKLISNPRHKLFVNEAFDFAYNCHKDQKRDSGRPYFLHPLNVALSLAEKKFYYTVICAGLLHDVVEDANISLDEINARFGPRVAEIVDLVTKPKLSNYYEWVFASHSDFINVSNENYKKESDKYYYERINIYYNRLFKSGNINALYLKLYDNLDNISDFFNVSPEKKTRTMENIMKHSLWLAKRLLDQNDFDKLFEQFKLNGFNVDLDDYSEKPLTNPLIVMLPREQIGFDLYKKMPLVGTSHISIYANMQSVILNNYLEIGLSDDKDYYNLLKEYFPEHKISKSKSLVPKSVGAHEQIYKIKNFRHKTSLIKVLDDTLYLKCGKGKITIKDYYKTKIILDGKLKELYLETKSNYIKFRNKLEEFFYKYCK